MKVTAECRECKAAITLFRGGAGAVASMDVAYEQITADVVVTDGATTAAFVVRGGTTPTPGRTMAALAAAVAACGGRVGALGGL